ncbi:AsmA family protein [Vibrio sp. PP-XX7]
MWKTLPQDPLNLSVKGNVAMNLSTQQLDLTGFQLAANELRIDGQSSIVLKDSPKIRFKLHGEQLDLDPFLGMSAQQPAASGRPSTSNQQPASDQSTENQTVSNQADMASAKSETPNNATVATVSQSAAGTTEPDLAFLKPLDIAGTVDIDQLKAHQVVLDHIQMKVSVLKGIATLSALNADLYQGKITAQAVLNANPSPATYQVKTAMTDVQVLPLLKALAGNDMLEGTGSVNVNLHGKGLVKPRLKQNVQGTIDLQLKDGAFNGINLAQEIRRGYAKIKGRQCRKSWSPKTRL